MPRKINANGFNGRINYQLDGSNNTESDRAGIRLIPISNSYVAGSSAGEQRLRARVRQHRGHRIQHHHKVGRNEYHGEAAYIFRRTPFSARPKLLPGDAPTPDVNVDSYVADGGGRIVRDKLFFFGAFEHVKRDLPAPVTVPAASDRRNSDCPPAMPTPFRSGRASISTWRKLTG